MSTPDPATEQRRLDGNAAAGPLRDVFALDLLAARCTCGTCGSTAALAEHLVYADAPALVVRCPGCSAVVLRHGTGGGRVRLELSGLSLLVFDAPD